MVKFDRDSFLKCPEFRIFDRVSMQLIMGISDIYMSIGLKRNISHFANIVRIAKSDKEITQDEVAFLSKIANKYNISNELFKEILKEPEKIPTIAHLECEERVERLYELMRMVEADHRIEDKEVSALRKIAIGLGFPLQSVEQIVERSIHIDVEEVDVEEFKKHMFSVLGIRKPREMNEPC